MSTATLQKIAAEQHKWEEKKGFIGFLYKNRYILMSFLIPFIIMTVAFGIMKVSPFGDKQILVTDLWHQYYPFLADYQDKLKAGESLFYSWSVGAGTNYFALGSYYLASPMNFLSVFIRNEWLREFLAFSVVTKIALAGMFMSIFLRYTFKKNDYSLLMFSILFSVCSFFMGYYWNTIWLDTVALTPLVAMGTVALLREGKFKVYVITLALSVLANYYIGLFTCIFVALIYIAYWICNWKGPRKFFMSLLKIAGFSAMALSITAFLMLPAFFALQGTHASSSTFPTTYRINIGSPNDFMGTLDAVRKVITNTLSFIEPNTKDAYALPNIACGSISLVLAIVFLACKKIKLREKLVCSGLLLFFTMSFIIRQLDYIWHGFHFTNMIPYRFSYLFSFVLIVMAFRAFMVIDFANYLDIILAALGTMVIILISIGIQEDFSIIGTAVLGAIIILIMLLYTKRLIPKQVMSAVLILVVLAEASATGYIGVKTTTVTGTAEYPRGEENTANVIEYMKEREKDTTELWRTEMTSTQTLNDGALNHYHGISMFNSMANESTTIFMENFGLMGWQSGNRYTYAESSPIADLFFNLKYLIARDGNYKNTYSYNDVYSSSNVKLLENNKYIPMGLMTEKDLLNWNYTTAEDTYNPIEQQGNFFKLATGINEEVYTPIQVSTQSHTDYEQFPVNKTSYGNYNFSCKDSSVSPHLQWNYNIDETGYYYAYVLIKNTSADDLKVLKNSVQQGGTIYIKRPYIMSLGQYSKGDQLSLALDLDEGAQGSAQVYVAKFNEDVFEKGYNVLKEHYMTTTKLTDSSMEGTIDAGDGGLFYASVPYEEGWSAYVDGVLTNITPVGAAMIAFELPKGEHTIKLSYIPKGYIPGTIISLMGITAFVLAIVINRRHKKKLALCCLLIRKHGEIQ
ncbi:MAG: YfhO family protein [Ruminococcus sp.]|nr:YfhO family protein [Ruminococcus sp.]